MEEGVRQNIMVRCIGVSGVSVTKRVIIILKDFNVNFYIHFYEHNIV